MNVILCHYVNNVYYHVATVLAITQALANSNEPKVCYQGWAFEKDRCYKYFSGPSDWANANSKCQNVQADLLNLNNADLTEQTFILSKMKSNSVWIGLRKNGTIWRWTGGGTSDVNNTAVSEWNCAALSNEGQGRKIPQNCTTNMPFYCERAAFPCPSSTQWKRQGHKCFKVMTSNPDRTWNEARGICRGQDADLAIFSDVTSEQFLLQQSIQTPHWVGMQFISNSKTFKWLGETSISSVSNELNMAPGNPNAVCGGMFVNGSNVVPVRDVCNATKGFICELAISSASCSQNAMNFVCFDGSCISASGQCDGKPDCSDRSDEAAQWCLQTTPAATQQPTIPGAPKPIPTTRKVIPTAASPSSTHLPLQDTTSKNGTLLALLSATTEDQKLHWRSYVNNYLRKTPIQTGRQSAKMKGRNTGKQCSFCRNPISSTAAARAVDDVATQSAFAPDSSQTLGGAQSFQADDPYQFDSLHGPLDASYNTNAANSGSTETPSDTSSAQMPYIHQTFSNNISQMPEFMDNIVTADHPISELPANVQTTQVMMNSSIYTGMQKCNTYAGSAARVSCLREDVFTDELLCQNFSNSTALTLDEHYFLSFVDVIDDVLKSNRHDSNSSACNFANVIANLELFLEGFVSPVENMSLSKKCPSIDVSLKTMPRTMLTSYLYADNEDEAKVYNLSIPATSLELHDAVTVSVMISKVQPGLVSVRKSDGLEDEVYLVSRILSLCAYISKRKCSMHNSFELRHSEKQNIISSSRWNSTQATVSCAYFDRMLGVWSTHGCETLPIDSSHTQCICNHTTSFAILMQITDIKINEADRIALETITYVGCSVSLLTMFIAITVFTCVRSLNSERVAVHRNLCIAITGANITFLAGIEAIKYQTICRIVALVLHYCYTAVFIWMLVEGLHLYTKVVQVFGTEKSRISYYLCFGWGVPLILVTISAIADWEGYGTDKSCWLSINRGTVWAFIGPAVAVIIVNIVILIMVVRIVISSAKLDKHGQFDHIRAGIKGALFLLPLLGLTWIFGLLAVNQDLLVFQYFFAIFNSLQGFFIFLFHCVLNTEVRQAVQRMREKLALQNGEINFTSASSTASSSSAVTPKKKGQFPPEAMAGMPVCRPTNVAPISTHAPFSGRHLSINSQDSARTKETDISNGRSPDFTFEDDELALIYI